MLLNYKGVSLYAELYNTALQNCHENITDNRKICLSAFPMVIMKKLMMFYSLTQQKLFTPRPVDIWKDDIISIFLMIMKVVSAWTQSSRHLFFLISIAFSYPQNGSCNWELGHTEQQHIEKQMHIGSHLPQQIRGGQRHVS